MKWDEPGNENMTGKYIDEVAITTNGVCPVCYEDAPAVQDTDFSSLTVTVKCVCPKCGSKYVHEYWLSSIYVKHDAMHDTHIDWGNAKGEDLRRARYTGKAYMAVPYLFNDDRGDREGYTGRYYKSPYDVNLSPIDVIRDVREIPGEGDRVGVLIYEDTFENGKETDGVGKYAAIYWNDKENRWDSNELSYFGV